MNAEVLFRKIDDKLAHIETDPSRTDPESDENALLSQSKKIVEKETQGLSPELTKRVHEEFYEYGPLTPLLNDPDVTEILVNGPEELWVERDGMLTRHGDHFLSKPSFDRHMEQIAHEAGLQLTLDAPCGDGRWRDFRVHLARPPISPKGFLLSLRRHPQCPWTLPKLAELAWCDPPMEEALRSLVQERVNFLVAGRTGSGKTSVLNALLHETSKGERTAVIEDTDEIAPPPGSGFKLLTRIDAQGALPPLEQDFLIRQCLRMRPDRLVIGEIRGAEAKDFLMALSTGHRGSFGSIHADDATSALLRLEMLIQMGAPAWSLSAIRRLILSSLNAVVICGKTSDGRRRLEGIWRIVSLEDHGFLMEEIKPRPEGLRWPAHH